MRSAIKLGIPMTAVMLIAGTACAAVQRWRHVMPEFVIDVRAADSGDNTPALILIYGENDSDPFREGPLGAGRRISQCQTIGSLCMSRAARKEFGTTHDRPQSLQVRLFTGKENPVVGGLRWTSSWRPKQVRVTCDLRIPDVRKSCAVSEVIS